ncbi:protealysin inhibitor emfourin [Streptomyces physcomitrii]|uniref:Metalloprotease n=1 Tax=Streptomyces physcomitrii TaxID=2724184 RepID=A0ABX1H271_9ACTN|nr:protealysin inhibitor emfourin [Streptomyces physcomitrii]NKI42467.1 hypothetical protein [Streptomyces physcomitrii]
MRIQVKRTGGFAAIVREAQVDTGDLPDAEEWKALADEALAASGESPSAGVPDGFHYALTIGDRTVHCADPGLTEAQRKLISRVLKEGA